MSAVILALILPCVLVFWVIRFAIANAGAKKDANKLVDVLAFRQRYQDEALEERMARLAENLEERAYAEEVVQMFYGCASMRLTPLIGNSPPANGKSRSSCRS